MPQRMIIAKKTKVQQPPPYVHYPLFSTKVRSLFKENILVKQAVKERALDLDSIGTDSRNLSTA